MEPSVCLVAMPWPNVNEPSLGLGILKAQLTKEQIRTRINHAYIDLLRHLTFETYTFVSRCWGPNEFVFTGALDRAPDSKQLSRLAQECISRVTEHSKYRDVRSLANLFLRLREEIIPTYLAECAQAIAREQPTMVGFTCMFDQTMASVALARLIKQAHPRVLIAFGGYALEGPPGRQVLKAFPWVDCIVSGDGEPVIADLARVSVGDIDIESIPGVITRGTCGDNRAPPIQVRLDSSPDPDYGDWFDDLAYLRQSGDIEIRGSVLPVESSRGCWYGQARHCIFCGIDDETLKYRSKSPQRVLDMLRSLRDKYGDYAYRFNDYILPSNYYKTLLVELAKKRPRYRLQCEIKANQNPARMRLFRDAGFTDLQPGIESFSSAVLRSMDKGVRAIQNVSTLKLGYVTGIVIHYNVLYGIPSDTPQVYREMLRQMPRLYHLQPPVSRSETEITRGAPLQTAPHRFGMQEPPRHAALYDVLFSDDFLARTEFDLDGYAYYFERPFKWSDELLELFSQLVIQVNHWKTRHRQEDVILQYTIGDGVITFSDSRFGEMRSVLLGELDAAVYMACDDEPVTGDGISRQIGCSAQEVDMSLERLDEERLIWREGEEVLGLGVQQSIVEAYLRSRWRKRWTSLYC